MSVTVYSYFNVNQVATLMDGVAALTASANFIGLIKVVVMVSFIVFIAGMAIGKAQEPFEFFRWFIILTLIHTILLIPKVDVVIEDRTGTSPPTVRSNVPLGLAFFASVTSHVGDFLTRSFETVFAMPDDLKFQKNGIMFGNTVLNDSFQTVPVSLEFRSDLTNYINNCTYYDILAGRISQSAISTTDDLWALLGSDPSKTHLTPISTDPSGSMPCDKAYANLNTRSVSEITKTMQMHGRVLNPQAVNNVAAAALLDSQLTNSYQRLTNISKSSAELLRQNMAINAVRDSQMTSAQHLDTASSAIIGAAQAQTEVTTNLNYLAMARVAERAAPAIRNVIEIICYAVFPIIILLLIVAGEHAGKIFKGYVLTLIWIQLIPPLYAVLNFVMTSVSSTNLVGIASSSGSTALNLVNIGQMSQRGISDMAIAGYLTLSLPVIAWALVKSGEIGGAALFGAVTSGAASSASHSSGNLAAGNISQENVSVGNTSTNTVGSNHYDVAPAMSSGYSRVTNAMGSSTTGADGTFRFQGNQSSLGFGANFGQKIGNALSSEAALRSETAMRESDMASQARTSALVERMGILRAYSDQNGITNLQDATKGSRASQTVSQLEQIAENVNKRLGLSADSNLGRQLVGEMSLGGSLGTPGGKGALSKIFGASIGIGDKTITTAQDSKTLESAMAYAKDALKSQNISADQGLYADFRSSEAYQWAKQNRSESVKGEEAALTSADTHSHNAERANSEAFALSSQARTVNENWLHYSMNYEGYVAKRLQENGQLEAFNMLYQNNPEQAAKLAARYLSETNFDVMPSMAPVSANVGDVQGRSPELAGKTLATESARFGPVADTTAATNNAQQSHVRHGGYQQGTINNDVGGRVVAANDATAQAVSTQGGAIASQRETTTGSVNQALERKNQLPGMKGPVDRSPNAGSAAAQHDTVHDDLFGKSDKQPAKK